MNILLWILQIVLAGLFGLAGSMKVFFFEKYSAQVASNQALSHELWVCIGLVELLCAACLVLPGTIKKLRTLTPVAAACLAVDGVLFAMLHYSYDERAATIASLVLAILAAVVAYGRSVLKPLAANSPR